MIARIRPWEAPLRLGAGAFIIDSGLRKLRADPSTAAQTHGFAAGAYPMLQKVDSRRFVRALATGELALGAALLSPVVPAALAGAGLTAFSAGLLGLYLRTPGMHKEGSLRPTEQGLPIAKDVWLFGIGLAFLIGDLTDRKDSA
ncbi:hypothetical protein E0H73_41770 [Kribbella pittospori]|uniref:DoxX family membrane protein n=1 Tax=Kribbella pittospori TaxID=722689 RepID=A0A4R0JSM1_9ACTN|nr:hypothetical protein [Kribbella pittospori]TCC50363.1 hypothetical protein E0H73_41770 [Kribbella pittospori]